MRSVFGLNLYAPNGKGRLSAFRADYVNCHTWAEVYLGDAGWVEIEPARGKNAFDIPASWVQNNRWFQDYAIWLRENGVVKRATWARRNGKQVSNYGVSHVIRYKERQTTNR
jgi:hypothetical protein